MNSTWDTDTLICPACGAELAGLTTADMNTAEGTARVDAAMAAHEATCPATTKETRSR